MPRGRAELTGPPMAPRKTASADLAVARASSVRGLPVASIEACVWVSQGWRKFGSSMSYTSKQLVVEVELDFRLGLLDGFEDLVV